MTPETEAQIATVRVAIEELTHRLHASGIPAETILATMTDWNTGQAIRILPPHAVADHVRKVADQVEAVFGTPVAGHAKVLQGMRK